MTIHLKKLCVGAKEIKDLYERQDLIRKKYDETIHITRMFPKKYLELMDGGSIFWVFKGFIKARQLIEDIDVYIGQDSIRRCKITLTEDIVLTAHKKERPFQGWRYLKVQDAPKDISLYKKSEHKKEDEELVSELSKLGLI